MIKIAVICRNRQQFDYFIREVEPEDRGMFVYFDNPQRGRGVRFSAIIRTGEWIKNIKAVELYRWALESLIDSRT